MAGEPWAPTLSDVGRHIPARTRDTRTPSTDRLLGTFTADTTPTDAQAQAVIDDAVAGLTAEFGEVPVNLANTAEVQAAARTAAEWRAAADIELAYPQRNADLNLVDQLTARAETARKAFQAALAGTGTGTVDLFPQWSFPDPPAYGDTSPGSGTDYVSGRY